MKKKFEAQLKLGQSATDWTDGARRRPGRRAPAHVNHSGGARKDERLRAQARAYLADAFQLEAKVMESGQALRTKPLRTAEVVDLALPGTSTTSSCATSVWWNGEASKARPSRTGKRSFRCWNHIPGGSKGKPFPPVGLGCVVQIATARGHEKWQKFFHYGK